jgi:molybdate transport system substrate-binding protein
MRSFVIAAMIAGLAVTTAGAAELRVLHGGAFTQVITGIVPDFEKQTGHKVTLERETVGALTKRIEAGSPFDVAILTPGAIEDLIKKGKLTAGSRVDLARVGVGVVVKAGAAMPDIGTVEAFKRAVIAAKSVAYIDPQAGGTSGIYVAGLIDKLGLTAEVNKKVVLIHGGAVAEHVAKGEAEFGIHQISEIIPVPGITLVGPLPREIQNFTTYAAALSVGAKDNEVAKALIKAFTGPGAAAVVKAKGMDLPGS